MDLRELKVERDVVLGFLEQELRAETPAEREYLRMVRESSTLGLLLSAVELLLQNDGTDGQIPKP